MSNYEILFYNGWIDTPAYYLVGDVEGKTTEQSLAMNLDQIIDEVRNKFGLDESAQRQIRESLYIVRADGLLSARER